MPDLGQRTLFKKISNAPRAIVSAFALVAITGCTTTTSVSDFSEVLERPEQTKTQLTDHMACFGDMLSDYRRAYAGGKSKPLKLAIVSVKDATDISTVDFANSEIPSDFSDMALGIASKIGGPVRLLHVPKSVEIVDGLRLAGAGPKPFNASHYSEGALQIYGALTEYDRLLTNRQRELELAAELGDGTGLTNIEASREIEKNTARMTMDFRVVQAEVGDVLNHVSSTNTLRLFQKGKDRSFGISVDGQGIGYATSESIVDARHKAIRLLIELGIIQVVGRYAKVPYWKCITPEASHTNVNVKDLMSERTGTYNFLAQVGAVKQKEGTEIVPVDPCALPVDKGQDAFVDPECLDNRDKELMMGVAADYEYAELVKQGARSFVTRPDKNFSFSGDPNATQLSGRKQKIAAVLKLYRANNPTYADIVSDEELIETLRLELVDQDILYEQDDTYSTDVYLALWANAPVSRGARWRLD